MEYRAEQEKDSWNVFFQTGKVEDYLKYASCKTEDGLNGRSAMNGYAGDVKGFGRIEDSMGDRTYAGYYSGNRDDTETESYRGIR